HVSTTTLVETQEATVTAVGEFVEDTAIPLAQLDRLDDVQRGRKLDQPLGIPGCQVQVNDGRQLLFVPVDVEVYLPEQALVWPRYTERAPPANGSRCPMSSRTWFRAMIITSACITGM